MLIGDDIGLAALELELPESRAAFYLTLYALYLADELVQMHVVHRSALLRLCEEAGADRKKEYNSKSPAFHW